jgi:hypothetical protein
MIRAFALAFGVLSLVVISTPATAAGRFKPPPSCPDGLADVPNCRNECGEVPKEYQAESEFNTCMEKCDDETDWAYKNNQNFRECQARLHPPEKPQRPIKPSSSPSDSTSSELQQARERARIKAQSEKANEENKDNLSVLRREEDVRQEQKDKAEREEKERAEAEKRAKAQQEAEDAEEARRLWEQRKRLEQEKAAKYQAEHTVPAGWMACHCPEAHSGFGKWIDGILYHPPGLGCP